MEFTFKKVDRKFKTKYQHIRINKNIENPKITLLI